ncbi:MAG: GntR family transcriptional regulator [Rubrivivax sp.]|nr:GntR family transcriptional regulator [Rubrivivax sp.]MDP3086394.1 GntR family transcriptional regulator [Rubrivivax sp.]
MNSALPTSTAATPPVPSARGGRAALDRRLAIAPQIHQALRERIVSLEWLPRYQLARAEIADEFGVSQTPVREALLRLEADGLIVVWPQSRTVVAPIDVEKVREVTFLRRALELEVALTVAAQQPQADLGPAQAIVDEQRILAPDDAGLRRFLALDRDFHRRLFELAGQATLHGLLVERSADLDRVRRLHLPLRGKRLEILADHQAILGAIGASDAPAVVAAMRGHLTGTAAHLDALVAAHPDYF